jgi:hypothetical protein
MKKVIEWLSASNRWRFCVGGCLIGFGSDDWYCALYAGTGVAAALELKDKLWGGKWDWYDLLLTATGAVVGHLIRWAIWN